MLAVVQARRRQRRRKPGASGRINGFTHDEGEGEEGEGGSASGEVGNLCELQAAHSWGHSLCFQHPR